MTNFQNKLLEIIPKELKLNLDFLQMIKNYNSCSLKKVPISFTNYICNKYRINHDQISKETDFIIKVFEQVLKSNSFVKSYESSNNKISKKRMELLNSIPTFK